MQGSLGQRSAGSSELRKFIGTDPDTGAVSTAGEDPRQVAPMLNVSSPRWSLRLARCAPSVSELLEAWFAIGAAREGDTIRW